MESATATLTEFTAAADEVAQAGYADLTKLDGLVGGALRPRLQDLYRQRAESGSRQVGTSQISDVTVAEYDAGVGEGGRERVVLEACVDSTNQDVLLPDGTSRLDPSFPKRLLVRYTVQNTEGHWTVDDTASDAARTC